MSVLRRRDLLVLGTAALLMPIGRAKAGILPRRIEALLDEDLDADRKLARLMPLIVTALQTDRCFIYMRDPRRRQVAYTHGYTALPSWRHFGNCAWRPEPNPATLNEPMLKKAFTDPRPLFIDDIEAAEDGVLNVELERQVFGHRALIHAPLHHQGDFYGILETAIRDAPRRWTEIDRSVIRTLQPEVAALAAEHIGHIQ